MSEFQHVTANARADWRLIYYALLAGMGVAAAMSGYTPNYLRFIFGTAAVYVAFMLGGRIVAWLFTSRPESPVAHALANSRRLSMDTLDRLALFFSSILFFVWLPPLKTMIPKPAGFFADPILAQLDRLIFGRDPWEIFHAVPFMGEIDWLYMLWVPTIVACSACVAIFCRAETVRRYFLSWALSFWILGLALAIALASAGPIFADRLGYGFQGLRPALAEAPHATAISDVLWWVYESDSVILGGGISAAPSMHCALSFLFVFAVRRTAMFLPALLYAAFIWFGSVYLGWHYFLDGALSLGGIVLIWRLAGRLTEGQRPADEPMQPAHGVSEDQVLPVPR